MGESATASTPGESFQGKGGALCHSQSANQLEKKSMKLPNPTPRNLGPAQLRPQSPHHLHALDSACLSISTSRSRTVSKEDSDEGPRSCGTYSQ